MKNLSATSQDQPLIQQEEDGTPVLWNKIWLKPNIYKRNFGAMICHYTLMPFLFVSVEVLQPILFTNKFGKNPQDAGRDNANVLIADIVTKFLFAPLFGVLNDRFGRQYILFYGIFMASLALMLMPLCTDIYPGYLLCRILYAHGAIAIATIPLLADYIKNASKGRTSSLNVLGASIGAMMASFIITGSLSDNTTINTQYWVISGVYFLLATSYTFFVKPGVYFLDPNQDIIERRNCIKMVKVGLRQAKCPWILMGYVTNFLSRADSILLTLFLVLWAQDNTSGHDYKDAQHQAGKLSGCAYTFVMLFTIVYGLLIERMSKFILLAAMFVLAALGSFMFTFTENPNGFYAYLSMAVLGIGMSGLLTAALYLINKYAEVNHRGYITGLANIFSVLGIALCVSTGYAVKSVSFGLPFTMFGIFNIVALGILAWCYYNHKRELKQKQQEQMDMHQNSTDVSLAGIEDTTYEPQFVSDEK